VNKSFSGFFRDPKSGEELDLEVLEKNGDDVVTGICVRLRILTPLFVAFPFCRDRELYGQLRMAMEQMVASSVRAENIASRCKAIPDKCGSELSVSLRLKA